MNELNGAEVFFRSRMIGDADLLALQEKRVYKDQAPQIDPEDEDADPPVYPLSVFWLIHSHDVVGLGGGRIQVQLRYGVRAICEGSASGVRAISNRTDRVLKVTTPIQIVTNGFTYTVLGCHRVKAISGSGFDHGVHYSWKGAHWDVYMSPAKD